MISPLFIHEETKMNEILSIERYLETCKGVTDLTDNGICSNCGGCCSNLIPVSESDKSKIIKYVRKHHIQDMRRSLPAEVSIDMRCPFRDEANQKCVIYPVRPAICRSFQCNLSEKDIDRNKMVFHHRYNVCDLTTLLERNDK